MPRQLPPLIIESRVNEYMMRGANGNVPYLPDEIAAQALECREAGAAVLHFHARKANGAPEHAYEAYRDTVQAIRARCDILIHPTLGYVTLGAPAAERYAHIERMHAEGIAPDFAPMDMGSSNVDRMAADGSFETQDLVYTNNTATLMHFAARNKALSTKPYLVAWNIGFIRQTERFMRLKLLDGPAYLCLLVSENYSIAGHPATPKGVQAFVDFLPADLPIEWTVCNFGGNLLKLAGGIIAEGGHISIGLGDYLYPELGTPTNAELVSRVVEIAREVGREVATPSQAREILGMKRASMSA